MCRGIGIGRIASVVFQKCDRIALRLQMVCLGVLVALLGWTSLASAAEINSDGPLTRIETSPDLNCAVDYAGDSYSEFFGTTACATLIAVDGTLYGPNVIPAGASASPRSPWNAESQSFSGAGTAVNPYRIITVVSGGGLRVTQTDTYVNGSESYGTRVSVANETSSPASITLYRAGDCYLQNSDFGYGAVDPPSGAVACTAEPDAGSRIEQWAPLTPGSHYYETYYNSLWAWIGTQQPFPDSCDCETYQDDSAGLSWTATINPGAAESFSHLTAFSPTGQQVEDSDGDGFPDSWEEADGGVDTNGDGVPDLKLADYGATANEPDVFVQVGWTKTRSCVLHFFCSTQNRRPSLAALRDVQDAFEEHGVRLHIDAGPNSVMNPDTGAVWGARSRAGDGVEAPNRIPGQNGTGFDWGTAFNGYRSALLPSERSRIFHFALYVGTFDDEGHTGLSRRNTGGGFGGRDLMLAYDAFDGPPTRIEEAGTLMHELGHNLGLTHGGALSEAAVNYKPNYPSVMNYDWQFSGVYKSSHLGLLDYSEGTLDPLDENALSETQGLEPDSAAIDIATKWRCPNGKLTGPQPSAFNVDWNCNGQISSGTYGANINEANDPTRGVLRDHDDWDSLVFDGGGALGGAGDPASAPDESVVEEAPATVLAEAAGDLQTVQLDGPGQLSIQSNTSSEIQLTITNHHSDTRTYELTTATSGVALSGLPGEITLGPGEAHVLTPKLTAGGSNPSASFEVDAISGEDLTDADSEISEVFVVDQVVPDQPGHDSGASTSAAGSARVPAPVPGARSAGKRRGKCRKHARRKAKGKVRCAKGKRRHHHRA